MKHWPYCPDCGWHKDKCPQRPWYSWLMRFMPHKKEEQRHG